jgi:glycosyltransferase involved in cell wall biosynthesis
VRLLIVAQADPRVEGSGAERLLAGHCSELIRRGHSLSVLSGGHGTSEVGRHGLTVVRVGWSAFTPWRVRIAAERLSARAPVDAVIIHHPVPAWCLAGSARLAHLPVGYVFLSAWHEEYLARYPDRSGPLHRVRRDFRNAVERRVIRRAARVYPLSRFMAERVEKIHAIPPAAIRVVPGGVETDRFVPAPDRAAVRRRLGHPPDAPVLFTLRNLEPRMGVERLIRAMPAVIARHPDALLVVGGSGPLAGQLTALTETLGLTASVRFTGFIPEADLPFHYQAADVFVIPTLALEGFGLPILEAMASGTPVLGSRVGAITELVEPLGRELLFAPGDEEGIARTLLAFFARPDRTELAARARAHAEAYDWKRVGAHLERELLELLR